MEVFNEKWQPGRWLFLNHMKIVILTLSGPISDKEIKINLNAFKGLHKTFWGTTKNLS